MYYNISIYVLSITQISQKLRTHFTTFTFKEKTQLARPLSPGGMGKRVEPPTKFSKWGDFTGSQFLEVGCWQKGGDLFQGGCSFYIKYKLKSEIFNDEETL